MQAAVRINPIVHKDLVHTIEQQLPSQCIVEDLISNRIGFIGTVALVAGGKQAPVASDEGDTDERLRELVLLGHDPQLLCLGYGYDGETPLAVDAAELSLVLVGEGGFMVWWVVLGIGLKRFMELVVELVPSN